MPPSSLTPATPEFTPAGWPRLIPRIFVDSAADFVDFAQRAFGARGDFQPSRPTELWFGDSILIVAGTEERAPASAVLYLYVEDVDRVHARALELGASSLEGPRDLPYGDRRAMLHDPWGNTWQIATHSGHFTS